MLNQRTKDLCFAMISKATRATYLFRRYLAPIQGREGGLHLHIGCGPSYLSGFVNVDANPLLKTDLWLDVRNGLPFPDDTVDSIYATHVLEHFFSDELQRLLCEFFRVLKKGGGVRLVVPSLSSAVTAYVQRNAEWFTSDFPQHYESLGGKFVNFLFCDGQHRSAFDFGHFCEVLSAAGFSAVLESAEGKSRLYGDHVPPYEPGDVPDLPHSLFVEAFK